MRTASADSGFILNLVLIAGGLGAFLIMVGKFIGSVNANTRATDGLARKMGTMEAMMSRLWAQVFHGEPVPDERR